MLWMTIWVHSLASIPLEMGILLAKMHFGGFSSCCFVCWLALQTPVDCIPHLNYKFTMCFRTLICCGWTCVYTFRLIYHWRWRKIFGVIRGMMAKFEWCCKVMAEASKPKPHRLHPTSMLYIYNVFRHLDMLWMDIWVQPYTDMPQKVGVDFWEIRGMV